MYEVEQLYETMGVVRSDFVDYYLYEYEYKRKKKAVFGVCRCQAPSR